MSRMQRRTPISANYGVGAIDKRVTEVLAGELIAVCVAALKQYGVDSLRIKDLCNAAVAGPGDMPTASRLMEDADRLADLATEWMEDVAYVDRTGRPRVLPINGPEPSFTCLAKKYFPHRTVSAVLAFGIETLVLERVGASKVAQFGGCVLFAGNPSLMLVHAIQSVRSFLGTTVRNAESKRGSLDTLPDRKASALIPETDMDEFVQVMRQAVINTVEMANRWLIARSGRTKQKTKMAKVGIHAYVFRDAVR